MEQMIKIYLNCRFLTQRITGVQRFAYEMCCELDKLLNDYHSLQIIGLMPKRPIQGQYEHVFVNIKLQTCGRLSGHLWEQLELPFFARKGYLINLCNVAPLFHFRQFITLHDVIFMTNMDSQKWWFKLWYRLIARFTSRFAIHAFTVSEFSKSEIIRYLSVPNSKVSVLGNGASLFNYPYQDKILSRLCLDEESYFLIIGSNSARKNINLVTSLFAASTNLSKIKLVVVGGSYTNLGQVNQIQATNIVYTGYIADGELRSLYRHAKGLIFPSLYEGFGIPVVEAMAEFIPLIVADIPVMHEVCGDSALYFNPMSSQQLELQLNMLLTSPDLCLSLINLSAKQLASYQWAKFAKITLSTVIQKADNENCDCT
ncbi:MAG: glycosyltransferase family 1 protein [Proteobacteria bacterium]|nr:MAG: glycosyltransferase family 1 protein [Pseudomonadota bacterium]